MQNSKNQLIGQYIDTPLGKLLSIFSEKGLCLLQFEDQKNIEKDIRYLEREKNIPLYFQKNARATSLTKELEEYFERKRTHFTTPLDVMGTDFQQKVWYILKNIPYGMTISYKTQAQLYGDEKSIRAVASANGKNRISILIPCHRVIATNGKLVGYAGGLNRKKELLNLEQYSDKIDILIGGGVRSHNIATLKEATNGTHFHSSAILDYESFANEEEIKQLKKNI